MIILLLANYEIRRDETFPTIYSLKNICKRSEIFGALKSYPQLSRKKISLLLSCKILPQSPIEKRSSSWYEKTHLFGDFERAYEIQSCVARKRESSWKRKQRNKRKDPLTPAWEKRVPSEQFAMLRCQRAGKTGSIHALWPKKELELGKQACSSRRTAPVSGWPESSARKRRNSIIIRR